MGEVWKPQNEGDVAAAVNDAIAARKTMELIWKAMWAMTIVV